MIAYTSRAFENTVRDVDAVIDTVGGEVVERSWQVKHLLGRPELAEYVRAPIATPQEAFGRLAQPD